MDRDLENLVRKCTTCREHQHGPVAAPLHPWEFPDGPWKRIHVDCADPFKGEMLSGSSMPFATGSKLPS